MFWSGGYTNLLKKFSQIDESIDKIQKSLGGENNEYQKGEEQDFSRGKNKEICKRTRKNWPERKTNPTKVADF